MIGQAFLYVAIGGATLFLTVLAFVSIEDNLGKHRWRP